MAIRFPCRTHPASALCSRTSEEIFLVFWCRLASSRKSAQTISIQDEAGERATMADTIPLGQPLQSRLNAQPSARVESVPWPIWCMIAGITSSLIGGHWDISWHMSIGRDTFWTPAHIMIQMNGVLVGIACAYMILTTTFGGDGTAQSVSVKIWGFRGPLGAFIATWGCIAMLTSAPFDSWWHNAYGLEVKILCPPHTLLSLGSVAVKVGALALMAVLLKLGPVYQNVTHLVPLHFPLLLIVPAVMLDLLWNRTEQWGRWKLAAVSGPVFLLSFLAAQWPFANFLMSPAARNWFFGMAYFAYFDPARLLYDPYKFQVAESTPGIFWKTMAVALVVSVITTRLGFSW